MIRIMERQERAMSNPEQPSRKQTNSLTPTPELAPFLLTLCPPLPLPFPSTAESRHRRTTREKIWSIIFPLIFRNYFIQTVVSALLFSSFPAPTGKGRHGTGNLPQDRGTGRKKNTFASAVESRNGRRTRLFWG